MPFCYSPWTNIDISPTGDISPCCKFQLQHYNQKFNIQSQSIEQYQNSDFLTAVKQEFEQGQWPTGCERCRIEEQHNIASKRQLDYDRWKSRLNLESGILTASIAFGNTCNLKCITCSSYASSKWHQESLDILGHAYRHFKFYKKEFVRDFVTQAPNLIHLDIPGGEPFLSGVDEQKQLLRYYIDQGRAEKIGLHYTTNATIFPDSEWWDLWAHFREVDIQLSIDGIGKHYEYIRYPAQWSQLIENTQKYLETSVQLSVSHTLSAYNVFYLDEFFTWCHDMKLPEPWIGKVHDPVYMRPTVWSNTVRQHIVKKLSNSKHRAVIKWADLLEHTNDSEYFEMFWNKTQQHDNYRGISFEQTFPELTEILCDQ